MRRRRTALPRLREFAAWAGTPALTQRLDHRRSAVPRPRRVTRWDGDGLVGGPYAEAPSDRRQAEHPASSAGVAVTAAVAVGPNGMDGAILSARARRRLRGTAPRLRERDRLERQ